MSVEAEPSPKPEHGGAGHRARLRLRLLEGGAEALADYEVLEYLLYGAHARGDTKPLAKELLARFGSLAGALDAEPGALMQVKGVSEATVGALKIAALAARRMARSEVRQKPILGSWQALLDYLTIDEAAIHPREVIRRGLDIGATALILVHNHPSGSPEPSRADIQITQRIAEAGRLLGITVHDHVIIGREGHVSLRAKGLI